MSMLRGSRWMVAAAGIFGGLGVIAGAIGSHLLKAQLPDTLIEAYDIGVHYLFIHALSLLACAALNEHSRGDRWLAAAAVAMVGGIIFFSGGLMFRAALEDPVWAKPAPLGGMLLIVGWCCIAVAGIRRRQSDD